MNISEIKTYLKENKITYNELSVKSGIPIGTLKSIFSGRTPHPRIDTVQTIKRALGLSNEILAEDIATESIDTKKSISPKAEEMLIAFRELGQKYGELAQDAAINVVKNMTNFKG